MRMVIDARMLDYSGIGTYLANVLPGVLKRCAALDPFVITTPSALHMARERFGRHAHVRAWRAAPLTWNELSRPPIPTGKTLWWAPHFNVPLLRSNPLVVTLHDLLPIVDRRTRWLNRVATRAWLARVRVQARKVICVSEFTRGHAVELAGIDSDIIRVIPLGARSSQSPVAPTAPLYLIFIGMAKRHKNIGGLLRAFERIASKVPHRLIIVGKRHGLRDIDAPAVARAARIGARVEWRENVPDDELARLIAGAALLVQPSFFEGFGLPPLEAMAAGTPVLAARAGALPEVCGDAALYCDPASDEDIAARMLEILENPALRVRLSAAGRARAALYSWERCADRTAEVLREAALDNAVPSPA